MTIHMIPFEPSHVDLIEEQNAMAYLEPHRMPELLQFFASSPWAFSGANGGGKIVISAGIAPLWEGVGEAWAIVDQRAQKHMLTIVRMIRRFFDTCPLVRVQAFVRRDFEPGHKLVKLLGFDLEADLVKSYHPGRVDCSLYARVKE